MPRLYLVEFRRDPRSVDILAIARNALEAAGGNRAKAIASLGRDMYGVADIIRRL